MTALPGWPAVSGAATFQHIRRSLAGQVAKSAAGVLRSGILPSSTAALVTGTATMNVAVGPFVAVADRNGAVFIPNDGPVNVLLSSAPGSGSRWSVVYAKQRESEAPFSDGATGPVIDKVESTTSEAAARALLPAGSVELAVVQVNAGSANTNAVGVTITQTAKFTAMEGGVVKVRNATDRDAWTPADGALAYQLDLALTYQRVGGAWVSFVLAPPIWYNPAPVTNAMGANTTNVLRTIWGASNPPIARGVSYSGNDPSTGGVFTPTIPGLYEVQLDYKQGAGGFVSYIYKNGASVQAVTGTSARIETNKVVVSMNGTTDRIEFVVFTNTATGVDSGTAALIKYLGPVI